MGRQRMNPAVDEAVREAVQPSQALTLHGMPVHYHADYSDILEGWVHTWYVKRDGSPVVLNATWPAQEAPPRLWTWAERALSGLIAL